MSTEKKVSRRNEWSTTSNAAEGLNKIKRCPLCFNKVFIKSLTLAIVDPMKRWMKGEAWVGGKQGYHVAQLWKAPCELRPSRYPLHRLHTV